MRTDIRTSMVIIQVMVTKDDEVRIETTKKYICACGNEARYIDSSTALPTRCGICDILDNGGQGERTS